MKLRERLDLYLVDEWPTVLLRSVSNWIAAVLSFLIGILGQGAMIAIGLAWFIPAGPLQYAAAGFIGFIAFGAPIIVSRLVHQPKMAEKVVEKIVEKEMVKEAAAEAQKDAC